MKRGGVERENRRKRGGIATYIRAGWAVGSRVQCLNLFCIFYVLFYRPFVWLLPLRFCFLLPANATFISHDRKKVDTIQLAQPRYLYIFFSQKSTHTHSSFSSMHIPLLMLGAKCGPLNGASRHNKSRHMFSVPLLSVFLIMCCAWGPAYADDLPANSVMVFVSGGTKVPKKVGEKDLTEDVDHFFSPFLVSGGGVMVAFAEAESIEVDKKDVDIAARFIEIKRKKWADKTTEKDGENWRTQLVMQKAKPAGLSPYALRRPTAAVRGNKIYLLALNNRSKDGTTGGKSWHFEIGVGEIKNEGAKKKIEWGPSEPLCSELTRQVENQKLQVFPGSGNSALLTSKGTIMFTVDAKSEKGDAGLAIMHLKDETHWEVSFLPKMECGRFSFFEWKGRLISTLTTCNNNKLYVQEYNEVYKEWKDVTGTLFPSWDNLVRVMDFTSVSIGDENVLLFTGKNVNATVHGRDDVDLWVTDTNHLHRLGTIIADEKFFVSCGLLYTNGELFAISEKHGLTAGALFMRLKDEMETLEFVLKTWAEKDAYISRPCINTAPHGSHAGTFCVTPMPTAGLVSFFSNTTHEGIWQDEYLYKNAAVKGGTKAGNGLRFNGAGEGAKWAVSGQKMYRLFDYSDYGLTLVATVIIHEATENDAPLLTVDIFKRKDRPGLWYSRNKEWKLVLGKDESLSSGWETNKAYRVALMVRNNSLSAYVNGRLVGGPFYALQPRIEPLDIENFLIGGYESGDGLNDAVSRVTVTNVLVYNRPLNNMELETLGTRTLEAAPQIKAGEEAAHVRVGAILLLLLGSCAFAALF